MYHWKEDPTLSLVPPLYLGVVHGFESLEDGAAIFAGEKEGFAYGRMGNPTVKEFEEWLTKLELGRKTFATTSGLAAVQLLVMALADKKREIVSSPFIYGGTYHLFQMLSGHGWAIKFVENAHDLKSWEEAITANTAFVFLETPANPRLDVFDIKSIADISHRKETILVVDNTIATPCLQRPLSWGADIVLHSTTKYLNRQSTGLGGAIVLGSNLGEDVEEKLHDWFVHLGIIMNPMTAWFCLNNSYTLKRDMIDFSASAQYMADWLIFSPKVKKVYYPGRSRQLERGASGLLAFEMHSFEAAKTFCQSLNTVILAPHLGDARHLIIHPASTTHSRLSPEDLAKVHITPELVRFSIGLGDVHDLIKDFTQALNKI